ncbi:hypothetical protein [Tenacibaculum maritimum]|uniref:hypothetical protein n=1 Tax=Tenacibaculum maritimum TaxID=107401 RepID=UPI00133005C4|nr:hypothetical protein [Tenacibaculum maritimum]
MEFVVSVVFVVLLSELELLEVSVFELSVSFVFVLVFSPVVVSFITSVSTLLSSVVSAK